MLDAAGPKRCLRVPFLQCSPRAALASHRPSAPRRLHGLRQLRAPRTHLHPQFSRWRARGEQAAQHALQKVTRYVAPAAVAAWGCAREQNLGPEPCKNPVAPEPASPPLTKMDLVREKALESDPFRPPGYETVHGAVGPSFGLIRSAFVFCWGRRRRWSASRRALVVLGCVSRKHLLVLIGRDSRGRQVRIVPGASRVKLGCGMQLSLATSSKTEDRLLARCPRGAHSTESNCCSASAQLLLSSSTHPGRGPGRTPHNMALLRVSGGWPLPGVISHA